MDLLLLLLSLRISLFLEKQGRVLGFNLTKMQQMTWTFEETMICCMIYLASKLIILKHVNHWKVFPFEAVHAYKSMAKRMMVEQGHRPEHASNHAMKRSRFQESHRDTVQGNALKRLRITGNFHEVSPAFDPFALNKSVQLLCLPRCQFYSTHVPFSGGVREQQVHFTPQPNQFSVYPSTGGQQHNLQSMVLKVMQQPDIL